MDTFSLSPHQLDARGGAQGGNDCRQDGDDELQDFLPKFFLVHDDVRVLVVDDFVFHHRFTQIITDYIFIPSGWVIEKICVIRGGGEVTGHS